MKLINEEKIGRNKMYSIYYNSKRFHKIDIKKINKEYDGFKYIFLLDVNGVVIEDVFYYLNNILEDSPFNTRDVHCNAIRILYSYLEIKRITLEDIEKKHVKELSNFIIGININGTFESYRFLERRSNNTHNLYFSCIREYLNSLGIKNKYIFEKRNVRIYKGGFGVLAHTKSIVSLKYTTNKNISTKKIKSVPKYISLTEFKNIIYVIEKSKSKNKLRNKLIILLMYTRGLRLGEVLGITLEDIKPHPDDKNAGIIILRNRATDKSYQSAKGCENINSKEDYNTSLYKEEYVGFEKIIIQPELMEIINQYINLSRDIFTISDTIYKNIDNIANADVVEGKMLKNYYLFLNKNGTPLSSSGWRKILIKYFTTLNIPIDKDSKKNNLSHKFRHGYAMYLLQIEKRSIEYIQEELRHRSILSTQRYFNPTDEDTLKATKIVQNNLFKILEGVRNEYEVKDIKN